jgi:hypothetical protein
MGRTEFDSEAVGHPRRALAGHEVSEEESVMTRSKEIDERIGNEGRRAFLKDVVLAGGATAMAAAAGGALAATPGRDVSAPEEKSAESGYRVTPHVKAYYDKARF